jgi:hypothetical protein
MSLAFCRWESGMSNRRFVRDRWPNPGIQRLGLHLGEMPVGSPWMLASTVVVTPRSTGATSPCFLSINSGC